MPSRLRRAAALVALAAAPAGCGGSDGGEGESLGEQVFTEAGCGGCHALAEAGAVPGSTAAKSLDGARLTFAEVERVVRDGTEGMPAFAGRFDDAEIAAVSEFVARASR